MKKSIKSIFFISLLMIFLTGCTISEKENVSIEEKIKQEIEYIEDSIFNITNKYAKGEYIKDNSIDWNAIFDDEERINNVLETIVLDLTEIDISNDEILKFSNEINNLLAATTAESEDELLARLNNLYALIPNYMRKVGASKSTIEDKELKSIILASYSLANAENWTEARAMIQSAVDKYNTMMDDVEYMQENAYKLNKTYILLGEVKNAIDSENMKIVNLKFVNFIEKN